MAASRRDLFDRVLNYQNDLIAFFAGGGKFDEDTYKALRQDLISNSAYRNLAPDFLRRCRDTGSLWSFAKSVDPSWEPRRVFLRAEFEPLLDYLENGEPRKERYPESYDSAAWTGVDTGPQQVVAFRTMIPLAQAAVEVLISHLETPNHNGAPPLPEVEEAVTYLKTLHSRLGEILEIVQNHDSVTVHGEGLIAEASRYGRRAAKALKSDPVPYALSATILGILAACGFPTIGGFLGGIAISIKKKSN